MMKLYKVFKSLLFLAFALSGANLYAASIYYCNASQKRCIVHLNEGQKGDKVRVIDEGAHLIDTGKIIMIQQGKGGKGTYCVVELSQTKKDRREIQKGYPVIVELEHDKSHLIWNSQIKSSGK